MKRKRFEVRRGETVRVELPVERTPGTKKASRDETDRSRGLLFSDDDPELYVRRETPRIQVFDLGTRLASVSPAVDLFAYQKTRPAEATEKPEPNDGAGFLNVYLEVEIDAEVDSIYSIPNGQPVGVLDPYNLGTNNLQASLSSAKQLEFDALLLGSRAPESDDELDPLGATKANGSGRALSNCLPAWFGPENQVETEEEYTEADGYAPDVFDLILRKEGEDAIVWPNAKVRETVRDIRRVSNDSDSHWSELDIRENEYWKEREEKAKDSEERWTPESLIDGQAFESGFDDTRKAAGGSYDLEVDSRLIFERFNTGDLENFKITAEPRFEADDVEFRFSPKKDARIYLKPVYVAFGYWEVFTYFATFQFETYRFADLDFDTGTFTPGYDHLEFKESVDPGPGTVGIDVFTIYAPDVSVGEYTLTLTASGPGTGTLSGGPGGAVAVTDNQTLENYIAGLRIIILISPSADNGDAMSATIGPRYVFKTVTASTTRDVVRGMHVGRWPVFPRSEEVGFDSVYTFNGDQDFDFVDNLSGQTIEYDAEVAFNKPGRSASYVPRNRSAGLAVYERHAERDKKRFAYNLRPMNLFALQDSNLRVLTTAEARTVVATHSTEGELFPAAAWSTQLIGDAEADADQIVGMLNSFDWIRNAQITVNSNDLDDREAVFIVPLDLAPAGLLVGIVQQGGQTRYIWRKTEEDRSLTDSERDQGLMRIPFA